MKFIVIASPSGQCFLGSGWEEEEESQQEFLIAKIYSSAELFHTFQHKTFFPAAGFFLSILWQLLWNKIH